MTRIEPAFCVFLVLLCSAIIYGQSSTQEAGPLVVTKVGPIQGLHETDGDYNMFLGIPYGTVNKSYPFGKSTPYTKFENTFEAFNDSIVCPQRDEFSNELIGSLDCLTLNIYVPATASSNNPLPVLIFIFGGALQFGMAGRYVFGPKFLVRHDIIIVTLNHRLGPYGFMCLDNPDVPGNQGIKDQLLALRWIKNNIDAFGGDINKITLSGQSAGSMSVDLHIHSSAENLFQQAILESGTVLTPFLFENPRKEGPLKMAKYLGYETDDANQALSFLAKADTNDVIIASEKTNLTFKVCVEKIFQDVEPIVTDYPVNLQAPKVRNITVLTGFSNDEEIRSVGTYDADYIQNNDIVAKFIKAFFDFDNCTYEEMRTVLKHFYFGDKEVNIETKRQLTDMASDLQGGYPVLRTMRKYFANDAKTIYSYLFSYVGERNYLKYKKNITYGGASHGDEIGYLYDVSFLKQFMSEEDKYMIDVMTTLWTNFVKYGNPTPETTDLLPVTWDPVTKDRWNYLSIDSELSMETRPFQMRMTFLDLFFKINELYQIGYRNEAEENMCQINKL